MAKELNPGVRKRLEAAVKANDSLPSICPLDGRPFKDTDACKHSVRDVGDAITGYRQLKTLGLI